MENSSTSPPSPAWPTRWPKDAFSLSGILLFLLVLLAATAVGYIVGGLVGIAVYGRVAPGFTESIAITAVADVVIFAFVLWSLPKVSRVTLRGLGLRAPSLRAVGIALLGAPCAFVAESLVGTGVERFTGTPHPQAIVVAFAHSQHSVAQMIFIFVVACAIVPMAEESVFRWFAFNVGMRYGGFWIGAIVSSILFGLAHGDPLNAPALATVGLVLCAVYYLSRNAFASAITHGLFNAISLVAVLLDPSVVNR